MRWIFRSVLALFLFLLLAAGALVALVLSVDPNRLKPEIQRLAAEQGVYLELGGNLAWQFYPDLGISIEKIRVFGTAQRDGEALASVDKAAFSVALIPLFSRQILVQGIAIEGLDLAYRVDKQGRSNWDALLAGGASTEATAEQTPPQSATAPDIEIKRIDLSRVNIAYRDAASDTALDVRELGLSLQQVNVLGSPMPLQLGANVALQGMPAQQVSLQASVAVNTAASQWTLSAAQLSLRDEVSNRIDSEFSSSGSWQPLQGELQFTVESANLRKLVEAFVADAFIDVPPDRVKNFKLASELTFNDKEFEFKQLKLNLDETHLGGSLSVTPATEKSLLKFKADLRGDRIDLDRYLPPSSTEPAAANTTAEALPLESLRNFNANLTLAFDQVVYNKMDVDQLALKLNAKKGLIKIEDLSAAIQQGSLTTQGQFDARGQDAVLDLNVSTKAIPVGYVLEKFADFKQLSGGIDGDIHLQSTGATSTALIEALAAQADLRALQLRFEPINLLKNFCEAAFLLEGKKSSEREWPKFTSFEPLTMKANLAKQVATLDSFDASIEKLQAKATGKFDIASGKFDFPFSLRLADFAADLEGCNVIGDKWRKQVIPLRCKGSLETLGVGTCKPDMDILRDKLKDNIKRELNDEKKKANEQLEKEKDKAEAKLGKDAEKLLDKKLKEEDKEKLKDLLKGLKK